MPASDYPIFRLSDTEGNPVDPGGAPSAYALLENTNTTGAGVGPIRGGKYLWSAEGTFGGATLTLQRQRRDGTWAGFAPAATMTAENVIEVLVGQDATLRVQVSGGTPSALYSDLAGV